MRTLLRTGLLALVCWTFAPDCRADALHCLWELHGRHNTVYLLGSIHVLRPSDYPLAPAVLEAYANSPSLVMEINLQDADAGQLASDMLGSAMLPDGKTLPEILGPRRYSQAHDLAHDIGVDLSTFDQFAPWFAAESISQLQLQELGFQAQSGVEMYFLERARNDGKKVAGLETAQDQIALLAGLAMESQADYLLSSLEQARQLPGQVDAMVHAWQRGDTTWFADQLTSELGRNPTLYQALLTGRNRQWIPKLEALLSEDKNYLVIVGTGHLVGRGSVIELLKKDGVGAVQR